PRDRLRPALRGLRHRARGRPSRAPPGPQAEIPVGLQDPVARMIVTAHAVTERVTRGEVTKRRHRGSVRSACTGENSIRRWSPLLGPVTSTYLQTRTPTAPGSVGTAAAPKGQCRARRDRV